MKSRKQNQGFNASGLQVRRAFKAHFGRDLEGKTYEEAGEMLVNDLGLEEARAFVLSQSNDPNLQD